MPHVKYKFRGSPCGPWPAPTQLVFDECLMPHASNDPKNGSDYTQIIRGEEGEWGLPYGPLSVRRPSKHDQTCGYCMNCLIFLSPQNCSAYTQIALMHRFQCVGHQALTTRSLANVVLCSPSKQNPCLGARHIDLKQATAKVGFCSAQKCNPSCGFFSSTIRRAGVFDADAIIGAQDNIIDSSC